MCNVTCHRSGEMPRTKLQPLPTERSVNMNCITVISTPCNGFSPYDGAFRTLRETPFTRHCSTSFQALDTDVHARLLPVCWTSASMNIKSSRPTVASLVPNLESTAITQALVDGINAEDCPNAVIAGDLNAHDDEAPIFGAAPNRRQQAPPQAQRSNHSPPHVRQPQHSIKSWSPQTRQRSASHA